MNIWTTLALLLGMAAGFYCGVMTERRGHERIKWPVPEYAIPSNPF